MHACASSFKEEDWQRKLEKKVPYRQGFQIEDYVF